MAQTIGFIGLGIMGRPMAKNLLAAGYPLVVHSRSRGPVDELVAAGAKAAGELTNNAVPPAYANAVADAVGVRVRSMPVTAERVYEALAEAAGRRERSDANEAAGP